MSTGGNVSKNESYDAAPAIKMINGQRHVKVAVPFGEGYAYKPVEDAPSQLPMADRFRAAITIPQVRLGQIESSTLPDVDEVDEVELLERAVRGHDGVGQDLQARLTKAREQRAAELKRKQDALDQATFLRVVGSNGALDVNDNLPIIPIVTEASGSVPMNATWASEEYAMSSDRQVRKKISHRKIGAVVCAAGVLVAGGGVAAVSSAPNNLLSTLIGQDAENSDEVKEVLPLPTAALVDAFGGCLDEKGNGAPLVELLVTSKTEVGYTYTSSKNTPKVLETNIYDENDVVVKANAKPVVISSNAPTKIASCINDADRGTSVTADGSTITVDLSKISPQLYQDVNIGEIARGFAATDTVENPMTDLWPVSAIIDNNVEADKAKPDTEEKMTPEIAASIMQSYNDNNNIVAEIRQAQVKTAEALIRPGGGYAEKIKAFTKEGIVAKIKEKAAELKRQGLTGVESPNVIFVSEMKNLQEINPEAPKAESFKLAGTIQITSFPDKLTISEAGAKK
jgi:hypothetical protein